MKKKSLTQLIQHSDVFSSWFANNIKVARRGRFLRKARLKNLRVCKQRFDSTSKPLGRSVIHLEALIATAVDIMTKRSGVEQEAAKIFLRFIDTEVAVQLGLLADCGDELLILTRRQDTEDADQTQFPQQLRELIHRLNVLYSDAAPRCYQTGYAYFMLQQLRRPMLFYIDGAPKTVGGEHAVTQDILDRCRGRMQNFVVLLVASCHAEFPHFEVIHHLQVFNAHGQQSVRSPDLVDAQIRSIEMIARFLQVDSALVWHGFERSWHIAILIAISQPDSPSHVVWRLVRERLDSTSEPFSRDTSRVLEFLAAFSGSTSGVEQRFSAAQWAMSGRRLWQSEALEAEELKLIADKMPDWEVEKMIDYARATWQRVGYGKPRRSGAARPLRRVDLGKRRRAPGSDPATEVSQLLELFSIGYPSLLVRNSALSTWNTQVGFAARSKESNEIPEWKGQRRERGARDSPGTRIESSSCDRGAKEKR